MIPETRQGKLPRFPHEVHRRILARTGAVRQLQRSFFATSCDWAAAAAHQRARRAVLKNMNTRGAHGFTSETTAKAAGLPKTAGCCRWNLNVYIILYSREVYWGNSRQMLGTWWKFLIITSNIQKPRTNNVHKPCDHCCFLRHKCGSSRAMLLPTHPLAHFAKSHKRSGSQNWTKTARPNIQKHHNKSLQW